MSGQRRTRDQRNLDVGFFDDPRTQKFIADVAHADPLTIFIGAGACVDQLMPTWTTLVGELLEDCQPELELGNKHNDDDVPLLKRVLDEYYLTPTASIVDALLKARHGRSYKARRNEALRRSLYADQLDRPLRLPALVQYVLRLAINAKGNNSDVHIITTNYDDLLEHTAKSNPDLLQSSSNFYVDIRSYSKDPGVVSEWVLPIVHVHGFIPREGRARGVIFSEPDYFTWQGTGPFTDYIVERFGKGHTLFVGSSLRDSNIAALLWRGSKRGGRRVALLPIQDDINAHIPRAAVHLLEERGRTVGVDVLRLDFYGQTYQFLNEVTLAMIQGENYASYSHRLTNWWNEWHSSHANDTQTRLDMAERLKQLASGVDAIVDEAQHTKAEIWIRAQPERRVLQLWSSSQSIPVVSAPYWSHDAGITHASEYGAVSTFASRSPTRGRVKHRSDDRWSHFIGVPVVLSGEPFLDLPVGVVCVLLDAPGLTDRNNPWVPSVESHLDEIVKLVTEVGTSLLS